ncbi:MFS transporter [Allorhizobium undicola]|uniref:MFS transporter n=1 Tax=Allorhizobium undicola TaxID=78527 RepID=UPI00137791AC|nr:MFS transporter [Allorhizobium undicola]
MTTLTSEHIKAPSRTRVISAVSIGNALEYYDLTLFTFFAVTIGKVAFPSADPTAQILLSLGVYGTGYCARPLGGLLIGMFGDRYGRKAAVNLTLLLMAIGTMMIGLTPSHDAAGVLAPIVVIAGRLLQGFSAGGETGASTTLLAESAPPNERGFFASWQLASQGLAVVIGAAIVSSLNTFLSPEAMNDWGWRIPFILGIVIVPIGLFLRSAVEETLDVDTASKARAENPVGSVITLHWTRTLWAVLALLGANAAYVILNLYVPTFGVRELHMSPATASTAALVGGISMVIFAPLGGLLSDRYGRKLPLILSRIAILALVYPAFLVVVETNSPAVLLIMVAVMSAIQGLGSGLMIAIVENFPKTVRVTGLSAAYAIGVMLSGGFGQMIVTWLISTTGSKLAPALYVILIGAFSLIGVWNMFKPLQTEKA